VSDDTMIASRTIDAPADAVFAVLADPSSHAAIDGTGWVRESVDGERLAVAGQVFRIGMYHPNHPDGHYEMANQVDVFDPPRAISWRPGQTSPETGELNFGGWSWRYDLAPAEGTATTVTLSYDWSAVPAPIREHIGFPPFPVEHLERSLAHLAELAAATESLTAGPTPFGCAERQRGREAVVGERPEGPERS
jgi:uncharacterized protein YndB with AHSA1/START domain